jgi:hypothetical protein
VAPATGALRDGSKIERGGGETNLTTGKKRR